jgi:hypothetical protein
MRTFLKHLHYVFLKRHVHVKPLDPTLFSAEPLVLSQSLYESAIDDLRRYGWRVAIHNVIAAIDLTWNSPRVRR